MTMKCIRLFSFCVVLTLAAFRVASADPVIFSTLGPGDTYKEDGVFRIGGTAGIRQGLVFTPTATGQLHTLELALVRFFGAAVVTAQLREHVDDHSLGAHIETFTFSGFPDARSEQLGLVSAVSAVRPILTTDKSYWLYLIPGHHTTTAGWNFSNLAAQTRWIITVDGETFTGVERPFAAFRLNAAPSAPVPEPATGLLLGTALVAASVRAQLKRKAARRDASDCQH